MAPIGSRPRLQIFLPYSAQCFARNKALKLFVLSLSWPLLHVGKLPFCISFWWPWLHSGCDVGKVKLKLRLFPLRNCSGCGGPPISFCSLVLTLKPIKPIVLKAIRLSGILRATDHELRLAVAGKSVGVALQSYVFRCLHVTHGWHRHHPGLIVWLLLVNIWLIGRAVFFPSP